jgi:hypothetical protein
MGASQIKLLGGTRSSNFGCGCEHLRSHILEDGATQMISD